ncbi:MAG: hypothetical protein ABSF15_26880 [Candidatus Sulfotelmatobacter sp.]
MTRIKLFCATPFRTIPSTVNSVARDKSNLNLDTTSALVFAALLIACSFVVGCSSEKPKPVTSTHESPITPPTPPVATMQTTAIPTLQAAIKPVHKKIVHKAPATLTYADTTSGVSFQYPRKYALETGDAATELVSASSIPMDFVQPGGVALAAVSLPDSTYPDSDLASAFFSVSVNKTVTPDQCNEFSVPRPDPASPTDPAIRATAQLSTPPISKLMIGDMELQSAETEAGGQTSNGPREEASKYYHVFQNGGCYEFSLNIATMKRDSTSKSTTKPVDREEVFHRLEKILATVRINPVTPLEVNREVKASTQPAPVETPAQ